MLSLAFGLCGAFLVHGNPLNKVSSGVQRKKARDPLSVFSCMHELCSADSPHTVNLYEAL